MKALVAEAHDMGWGCCWEFEAKCRQSTHSQRVAGSLACTSMAGLGLGGSRVGLSSVPGYSKERQKFRRRDTSNMQKGIRIVRKLQFVDGAPFVSWRTRRYVHTARQDKAKQKQRKVKQGSSHRQSGSALKERKEHDSESNW